MKWKPLLLQMPVSIILLTLLANFLGLLSSTLFQSIFVIVSKAALVEGPIVTQINYSFGAGMFIAYGAVPFSLALVVLITLCCSRFNKWHLIVSILIGLIFGTSYLGSIYWGIPILAYVFTTAVSTCLLIMWRHRKHLAKQSI